MRHKRLISMLILSSILLCILIYTGDLDQIVSQVKDRDDSIPIGKMHDCDPGVAICSMAQIIDGQAIKLSLSFNDQVRNKHPFQLKLGLDGINKDDVRRVEVFFQPKNEVTESSNEPTIERFVYDSGSNGEVSYWLAQAKLNSANNKLEKWQAKVKIKTLQESYSATFLFSIRP